MRAVLCSDHVEGREALRQAVINSGLECTTDDCVGSKKLLPRLVLGNVHLVVVEVNGQNADALSVIEAAAAKTQAPIVAIGPTHDANLILRAQRAGARQFLDHSHPRDELIVAMEKLSHAEVDAFRRGRTLAVTAAIAGTGVTTVASGLAFALAVKHPKQVALVELGADVPELALDLDVQPPHTLTQVLRDWERMDSSTIRQAILDHPKGVQILLDPPGSLSGVSLEPAAAKQICALLRTIYDYTVFDLGHGAIGPGTHQALRMADTVVVVVRLDVPSLRLTKIYLKKLDEIGVPQEKIFVVANRYGQRRQLPWKRAEEALGLPVRVWLPDDPATLNQALNHGLPLVEASRRARITRRFDQMAKSLNGAVK